jgi:hypothetical protein
MLGFRVFALSCFRDEKRRFIHEGCGGREDERDDRTCKQPTAVAYPRNGEAAAFAPLGDEEQNRLGDRLRAAISIPRPASDAMEACAGRPGIG